MSALYGRQLSVSYSAVPSTTHPGRPLINRPNGSGNHDRVLCSKTMCCSSWDKTCSNHLPFSNQIAASFWSTQIKVLYIHVANPFMISSSEVKMISMVGIVSKSICANKVGRTYSAMMAPSLAISSIP